MIRNADICKLYLYNYQWWYLLKDMCCGVLSCYIIHGVKRMREANVASWKILHEWRFQWEHHRYMHGCTHRSQALFEVRGDTSNIGRSRFHSRDCCLTGSQGDSGTIMKPSRKSRIELLRMYCKTISISPGWIQTCPHMFSPLKSSNCLKILKGRPMAQVFDANENLYDDLRHSHVSYDEPGDLLKLNWTLPTNMTSQ